MKKIGATYHNRQSRRSYQIANERSKTKFLHRLSGPLLLPELSHQWGLLCNTLTVKDVASDLKTAMENDRHAKDSPSNYAAVYAQCHAGEWNP